MDTNVMTATGKSLAENLKDAEIMDPEIIYPLNNPKDQNGGIAIIRACPITRN